MDVLAKWTLCLAVLCAVIIAMATEGYAQTLEFTSDMLGEASALGRGQLMGGYKLSQPSEAETVTAVQALAKELKKDSNSLEYQVLNVYKQVVAGMNYKFFLKVDGKEYLVKWFQDLQQSAPEPVVELHEQGRP